MELIKIYNGSLVDARELFSKLGYKKNFSRWFKRVVKFGFEEDKDYTPHQSVHPQNKQAIENYMMTLKMAKHACMVDRSDSGQQIRDYFIQCEEAIQELKKNKRFEAFSKLEATKERLAQNIKDLGGTQDDYLQIDLEGRKVLFNGHVVPDEELHLVLLKGRDFATELTNMHLQSDTYSIENADSLNKDHHKEVRETIKNSMSKNPEDLPREEKIKKLGE